MCVGIYSPSSDAAFPVRFQMQATAGGLISCGTSFQNFLQPVSLICPEIRGQGRSFYRGVETARDSVAVVRKSSENMQTHSVYKKKCLELGNDGRKWPGGKQD